MKAKVARHLLSVALLPFVVTVVVPLWIARGDARSFHMGSSASELALQGLGVLVLAAGLTLFLASLTRFFTEGEGTLAPWDPPRQLVVRGPYRYVRNPMISGVVLILAAEALLLLSRSLGIWALTFFAMNAVYIPLLEEPGLASRFGASYDEYRRHVPRLIPRLTPWKQGAAD